MTVGNAPREAMTSRIPFAQTLISPAAREAAARVLASGWVTTGPEVAAFEEEMAAFVGARYAVGVSSCTAAIELALRSLALPSGAKVLTPSLTFCGAVHAIVHAGLRPVPVDVSPTTLMPTPASMGTAAQAAGGVDAAVVLHYAGQPAGVADLAAAAGLPLSRIVEDAAHGLGTSDGDNPVGSGSAATCFSFYATKNLPIGEGGMVTTDDETVAQRVRRARLHGMTADAWQRYLPGKSWRYQVDDAGLKANMTDLQAAIGRGQLLSFASWQATRNVIAQRYLAGLRGVVGLALPVTPVRGVHSWHLFVVRVLPSFGITRDDVAEALDRRGIGCSVHFIPAHHQPYFRRLFGPSVRLPETDRVAGQILSLPLHPAISQHDVDRVCAVLRGLRAADRATDIASQEGTLT